MRRPTNVVLLAAGLETISLAGIVGMSQATRPGSAVEGRLAWAAHASVAPDITDKRRGARCGQAQAAVGAEGLVGAAIHAYKIACRRADAGRAGATVPGISAGVTGPAWLGWVFANILGVRFMGDVGCRHDVGGILVWIGR